LQVLSEGSENRKKSMSLSETGQDCLRLQRKVFLTEGTRDDLVAVGVIERDRVYDVPMALEGQQLVTRDCVPDLASAIVTAGDELIAGLVEGAVRQRQDVCAEDLEQEEVAGLVAL
jgi:hypothetical protein